MHLNLGYRWCCRLGLEDIVPDHKHKKVRYKPGQARCPAERGVRVEQFVHGPGEVASAVRRNRAKAANKR